MAKVATQAEQRAARKRVETAVEEIISRAVSAAFDAGLNVAARENPGSRTGHYVRTFGRLLRERAEGYDNG